MEIEEKPNVGLDRADMPFGIARAMATTIESEYGIEIHRFLRLQMKVKPITRLTIKLFSSCLALWLNGFKIITASMVANVTGFRNKHIINYILHKLCAFRVLLIVRGGNAKYYRYILSENAENFLNQFLNGGIEP
jgi:hypothetical protein